MANVRQKGSNTGIVSDLVKVLTLISIDMTSLDGTRVEKHAKDDALLISTAKARVTVFTKEKIFEENEEETNIVKGQDFRANQTAILLLSFIEGKGSFYSIDDQTRRVLVIPGSYLLLVKGQPRESD